MAYTINKKTKLKTKLKTTQNRKSNIKRITKHTRKIRSKSKVSRSHASSTVKDKDVILHIGGAQKNRVLIVVDVQQCFFENFGTMGWLPKGYFDPETNTNTKIKRNELRDKVKKEFSRRLNEFIKKAKSEYDIIVFTKDRHPVGHRSFGTYPPHCINEQKQCNFSYLQNTKKKNQEKQNIKENTTGSITKGHKLISANSTDSTDLEELNYDYKISYGGNINADLDTLTLNKLDLTGKIKYEKVINHDKEHKNTTTNVNELNIDEKTDAIIVRLNKGELCNFDAYGAFVYHVEYKESIKTPEKGHRISDIYSSVHIFDPIGENNILHSLDSIGDLSKISTGLGEFLLKYYNKNFSEDMVIDVCGLVTNICVVNTCIGGVKFFENVKNLTIHNLTVPHFRILNEFSLYLYAFPDTEVKCLDSSNILYEIYNDEDAYSNKKEKVKEKVKEKRPKVSIIGTPAADGYTPLSYVSTSMNTAVSNI